MRGLGRKAGGFGALLSGEDSGETSVFEHLAATERKEPLLSQGEDKGQQACVAPGEFSSQYKKVIFDSENIHWNNLLGHVAESPELEVFKTPLDKTISSEFPFPGKLGPDGPFRSFQPGLFCGSAIVGAATALGALGDVM